MRILTVTTRMPRPDRPSTMVPVARQIESLRAAGVEVDVLEMQGLPWLKYAQSLPSLWRMSQPVDLIHAHFGYCGLLARAQFGKPLVVSFMGSDLLGVSDSKGRASLFSRVFVQINRLLARSVDAVIVKSAEMAEVVAPVKAHVIPNGVDLSVFRPMDMREARRELGLADDRRYVLFPGSPANPRKGYPLAVDTVERLSRRIGQPVELLALDGVEPDRVATYMNASDAVLLTSFWEGSPNVVKEAMACDRPIVSVGVGDVPDLLSGVAGTEVGPRDPDVLAETLARIVEGFSRSEGRAALIRRGLDQDSVAHRVIDIYEEVLGGLSGRAKRAA